MHPEKRPPTAFRTPHGYMDGSMQFKKCARCTSEKPTDLFGRDKARKDGLNPYCKACARERNAEYARLNPERVRASQNAYDRRNAEKIKRWRAENSEHLKEYWVAYGKKYRAEFPAEVAEKSRRQYVARRRAVPPWFDKEKVAAIYAEAKRLRKAGIQAEVDHIFPIQGDVVCGLHWHGNMQILTRAQNTAKGSRIDPAAAPLASLA